MRIDYKILKNIEEWYGSDNFEVGSGGVVMDGRDIGTVVFPKAEYKFFLEASTKLRAQRRYDQLTKEKNNVSFEDVYKNIISRDNLDIHRSNSPLKKASDAILIDTENLSLDQLEDKIFQHIVS